MTKTRTVGGLMVIGGFATLSYSPLLGVGLIMVGAITATFVDGIVAAIKLQSLPPDEDEKY